MQKFIFLGIGLVLNLLEDAVGRLELALGAPLSATEMPCIWHLTALPDSTFVIAE